jgi:hypothetical protein
MGLFDFFRTRSEQPSGSGDRVKALEAHQKASRIGAVSSDELPNGFGPFGLCETNPIPTKDVFLTDSYLVSLRTMDGRRIKAKRIGSTSAEEITAGPIDMYQLSCEGRDLAVIYICPYHNRNSRKAPEGFRLA